MLGSVELNLIDSLDEAFRFKEWLGQRRPLNAVALDLETGEIPGRDPKDALSPWHGRIRLLQIGDSQTGWAMAWDEWAGLFYETMTDFDGPIICHNIAFEAKWMAVNSRWKFPWHQAHDTILMSQIINPLGPHGLKPLTDALVDPMASFAQEQMNVGFAQNNWTWGTVPIKYAPYWQYGALDTVITSRIFHEHFWPKVQPGSAFSIPYELEMNVRRIATEMEVNGARVDLDYSQQKRDQLFQDSERLKQWGQETAGVSLGSTIQLAKKFEELGATITKRTPGGAASVDKEQLDLFLMDPNKDVQYLAWAVVEQRKAEKLATTYFENFLTRSVDGLLHPDILTSEARTGRMSMRNPALQTLPSKDPLVRDAFLPRNEGEVIISSDLDQVEFRIMASFSKDPGLIALFKEADENKGDVFTSIMQQVYKDPTLVKADPRRTPIKSMIYGGLYGAGVAKRAATAGVPVDDMQELVDEFDRAYPGVKSFQKATEHEGLVRLNTEGVGYVLTQLGRRLPGDSDRMYALVNYAIQGSAAEVFKQCLVRLDQAGLLPYMVLPVHDEIVISAPVEIAQEVKIAAKEAMTTRSGWAIPLSADAEGPFTRWGEKYRKKGA